MTVTSGAAALGIQTVVVILPSDLTYPVYEIIQVRGTDNRAYWTHRHGMRARRHCAQLERLPTRTSLR